MGVTKPLCPILSIEPDKLLTSLNSSMRKMCSNYRSGHRKHGLMQLMLSCEWRTFQERTSSIKYPALLLVLSNFWGWL